MKKIFLLRLFIIITFSGYLKLSRSINYRFTEASVPDPDTVVVRKLNTGQRYTPTQPGQYSGRACGTQTRTQFTAEAGDAFASEAFEPYFKKRGQL